MALANSLLMWEYAGRRSLYCNTSQGRAYSNSAALRQHNIGRKSGSGGRRTTTQKITSINDEAQIRIHPRRWVGLCCSARRPVTLDSFHVNSVSQSVSQTDNDPSCTDGTPALVDGGGGRRRRGRRKAENDEELNEVHDTGIIDQRRGYRGN